MSTIRIGKNTEVLAERRFYDDTYLTGADGTVVAFIVDAAVVRYQSGREAVRTKRDVVEYPDADALIEAIRSEHWVEAPVGDDRFWKPERSRVEGT